MTGNKSDDGDLEAFFQAAREDRPEVSAAFLARLDADAEASLPQTYGMARPAPGWRQFFAWAPSAGGLVAATAAGVWIGFATPELAEIGGIATLSDESLDLALFLPASDLAILFEDENGL